jgi:uncharacterized membrane protein
MKFALLWILAILNTPAHAMEKMNCHGTEPFWGATLSDGQVVLELSDDTETYLEPTYMAAAGASPDYVMSVQTKNRTSSLIGFVVNETSMVVADGNGEAPPKGTEYQAYCSDAMSDRAFPFSIHLMVDEKPYTGCCWTASNPPREPK